MKAFHFALLFAAACTASDRNDCPDNRCRTIQVAISGDDSADGVTVPVKTLKRAIELASTDTVRNAILVDAGEYSVDNGETYPYTVPPGVTITGAPGTMLVGNAATMGLSIETGALENLELRDFSTAIQVAHHASLANITVRTSKVGIVTTGTAQVTAAGLALYGTERCSHVGVRTLEKSQVTLDRLSAVDIIAIDEQEQSTISMTGATITANLPCMLMLASGRSLTVTDTSLSGGNAMSFNSPELDVTLQRTRIVGDPDARPAVGGKIHQFHMMGGYIRGAQVGAALLGGEYQLSNVEISGNSDRGVYVEGQPGAPSSVVMRDCLITNNGDGVYVGANANGNFGTPDNPGHNTFRYNAYAGLSLNADSNVTMAVGNTWMPHIQEADERGTYPTPRHFVDTPVEFPRNFSIVNDRANLQL